MIEKKIKKKIKILKKDIVFNENEIVSNRNDYDVAYAEGYNNSTLSEIKFLKNLLKIIAKGKK